MSCSAPEITAVSNPKRKPPRATVTDQNMIRGLFITSMFKVKVDANCMKQIHNCFKEF
jgi:hypothetical protein